MSLKHIETSALARQNYWLKSLNEHIQYLKKNSWYYKDQLMWAGPEATVLEELADIQNFPFTEKDDIASRNEDFLCVPMAQVRDIVTTSGTLGGSVASYLTQKDLHRLGVNEAGSYRLAGCDENDTFQLLTTIDKRFMAGLAYFLGANELGARMIRSRSVAIAMGEHSALPSNGIGGGAEFHSAACKVCARQWNRPQQEQREKDRLYR